MASSSLTTNTPTQSLRPRTRRLISGLDDEDDGNLSSIDGSSNRYASPRGTPLGSRPVSPIPSKHPSRTTSLEVREAEREEGRHNGRSRVRYDLDDASMRTSSPSSFSWGKSWSALQGLASNVLGSDIAHNGSVKDAASATRRKRKAMFDSHRRTTTSAPPAQWGPSGAPKMEVGVGSKEERDALVRARKRRDLLDANGYERPDVSGRFKRRTSEDRTGDTGIGEEGDGEGEALVYLHTVRKDDTMQGLSIRYNVQQTVLRKANRMWAHDSVQSRKVMVVPVDAAGVKGKPVSGPLASTTKEEDLLQLGEPSPLPEGSNGTSNMANELPNGWHLKDPKGDQLEPPSSTASSHAESESPWKHDSWVLLSNDSTPTEIARMPRRTLGFFPPARRKSFCYSDGTNNTPSVSFDLPRPTLSPAHRDSTSLTSDPSTDPSSLSAAHATLDRMRSRPTRSSSLASSASVGTLSPPLLFLSGPGGVGSLNNFAPGPGPDSLNRILGPHLPNVQPPPGTTFNPPPSFPSILESDFSDTSFKTGAYRSYGGGGSTGNGPNFAANLAGVEKWVRKTAGQVSRTYSSFSEAGASGIARSRTASGGRNGASAGLNVGVAGMGAGAGVSDLIELTDAFEIGGDEFDGDDRDGDDTPVAVDRNAERSWRHAAGSGNGSGRADVPLGMSRRVGRSGERDKDGKDD